MSKRYYRKQQQQKNYMLETTKNTSLSVHKQSVKPRQTKVSKLSDISILWLDIKYTLTKYHYDTLMHVGSFHYSSWLLFISIHLCDNSSRWDRPVRDLRNLNITQPWLKTSFMNNFEVHQTRCVWSRGRTEFDIKKFVIAVLALSLFTVLKFMTSYKISRWIFHRGCADFGTEALFQDQRWGHKWV